MTTEHTPEQIAALTIADVKNVYSGRPTASGNHCRCGCCGKYTYNAMHFAAGDDPGIGYAIDGKAVSRFTCQRILASVQAHVAAGGDFSSDDEWIDVTLASGRSHTIYLMKGDGQ